MAKFRKKPIIIDAWQWQGTNALEASNFCICTDLPKWEWLENPRNKASGIAIPTLEGTMIAEEGDWIIRGVKGEYYPCKPDIFELTYESYDPERI